MSKNIERTLLIDLESSKIEFNPTILASEPGEEFEVVIKPISKSDGKLVRGLEGVKLVDSMGYKAISHVNTIETDRGYIVVSKFLRLGKYILSFEVEELRSVPLITIEITDGKDLDLEDPSNCAYYENECIRISNSNEEDFYGSPMKTVRIPKEKFEYFDGYLPNTSVGAYVTWGEPRYIEDLNTDPSRVTIYREKLVVFNEHNPPNNKPRGSNGIDPVVVGSQLIEFSKCDTGKEYSPPTITTTNLDSIYKPTERDYCLWVEEKFDSILKSIKNPNELTDYKLDKIYNSYPIDYNNTISDSTYIKHEITDEVDCESITITEILMEGDSYDGSLGLISLPLPINEVKITAKRFVEGEEWESPTIVNSPLVTDRDPNLVYEEKLQETINNCREENDRYYSKYLKEISYSNERKLFKDKYVYMDGGDGYNSKEPVYLEWVTDSQVDPLEMRSTSNCYLRPTKNYDGSWKGFDFPIHLCTATFEPQVCSLLDVGDEYIPPKIVFDTTEIHDPGIELEEMLREKIRECRERNIEELGYFNMRLVLEYKRDKLFGKYEYISDGDITSNTPVYLSWQVDRPTDRAEGVITAKLVFQKTLKYDGSWPGFEFPIIKEELIYTPQACSLMDYDTPYVEPKIESIVYDIEDKGMPYEEKRKEVIEECIENNKKHYLDFIESLTLTHIRGKLFDKYLYAQGGTSNSVEPVYLSWDIDDSGDMVEGEIKATLSYKPTRNYDNSWTGFNFPVVVEELTYTPQVCSLIGYEENYIPPKISRTTFEIKDPNPSPEKPPQEEMDKIRDQKRKECYEKNTKLYHEFVDSLKITPKPKILFDKYLYMDGGDKSSTLPVYTTWSIENSGNHIEGQTIFKKIYQPTDNYDCSWDGFRFPIVEKIIVYTPTNCSLMEWDDDWNSPSIEEEDVEIWDPNDPNITPPDPEYPCDPDPTDPDPPVTEGPKDACPLRCDLIGLKPGEEGDPDNKIYDKLTGICKCKYNPFK